MRSLETLCAAVFALAPVTGSACGGDGGQTSTEEPDLLPFEVTPDAEADSAGTDTAIDSTDAATDATPLTPLPALVEAHPADGAVAVPATSWIVLRFAGELDEAMLTTLAFTCDRGAQIAVTRELLDAHRVLVNPIGPLPAEASCTLSWSGAEGPERTTFSVATSGEPAEIPYDRRDRSLLAPFPDDTLLLTDPGTATGVRVTIPELERPDDVNTVLGAVSAVATTLDGFSPLAPIVVTLPAAADPNTLPLDEAASLDPMATIGLFDIDPASPSYLERRPFDLIPKHETDAGGADANTWIFFPTAPLEPRGRYALLVSTRALVGASRPLAASPYMSDALTRERSPAGLALAHLSQTIPAVRADDVALLLSISVRSTDGVADDLLAIREMTRAGPAPELEIDEVVAVDDTESPVAAFVTGSWLAPTWRDGDYLARDDDGVPTQLGTHPISFVLALPRETPGGGPAPLLIYQHGNPGSAEDEVPRVAERELTAAGFAVIGFTNIQNREIIQGGDVGLASNAIFLAVLQRHRFPDYIAVLDTAEQLSLIHLVPELDELDMLPLAAPDGVPDIDVTAPLGYLGISHGSHQGVGLMPFAPEIRAAALVVGGGRWSAGIVHQESDGPSPQGLYEVVTGIFPNVSHAEFWVGIALSQMAVDSQDWLMHARHLYREPHALEVTERASVLMYEGLGDSFVPTASTRAAALAMGIPQLEPAVEPIPLATRLPAPLVGNIDPFTTAALVQMVPAEAPIHDASPGCEALFEGHYCPQIAATARAQRVRFFVSALSDAPRIEPLSSVRGNERNEMDARSE